MLFQLQLQMDATSYCRKVVVDGSATIMFQLPLGDVITNNSLFHMMNIHEMKLVADDVTEFLVSK